MKPTILLQLDPDPQPSTFDAVVAVDAGVEHLLARGAVAPEAVPGLVHGALFTRGIPDLPRTAIFVGGSNVASAEALFEAVKATFFGPFRVSVLLDPNGSNTTAAAAVLAAIEGAHATRGGLEGATIAVLAATGPVGQRVARLLLGLKENVTVAVGSRQRERAADVAASLKQRTGREAVPFATSDATELLHALRDAEIIVAAGAAGATLLPKSLRDALTRARVVIDLNAVPPAGIEGIEPTDKKTDRAGTLCWGALGVGAAKMKIHKQAIRDLFTANDRVLDAEECLAIGRGLGA